LNEEIFRITNPRTENRGHARTHVTPYAHDGQEFLDATKDASPVREHAGFIREFFINPRGRRPTIIGEPRGDDRYRVETVVDVTVTASKTASSGKTRGLEYKTQSI